MSTYRAATTASLHFVADSFADSERLRSAIDAWRRVSRRPAVTAAAAAPPTARGTSDAAVRAAVRAWRCATVAATAIRACELAQGLVAHRMRLRTWLRRWLAAARADRDARRRAASLIAWHVLRRALFHLREWRLAARVQCSRRGAARAAHAIICAKTSTRLLSRSVTAWRWLLAWRGTASAYRRLCAEREQRSAVSAWRRDTEARRATRYIVEVAETMLPRKSLRRAVIAWVSETRRIAAARREAAAAQRRSRLIRAVADWRLVVDARVTARRRRLLSRAWAAWRVHSRRALRRRRTSVHAPPGAVAAALPPPEAASPTVDGAPTAAAVSYISSDVRGAAAPTAAQEASTVLHRAAAVSSAMAHGRRGLLGTPSAPPVVRPRPPPHPLLATVIGGGGPPARPAAAAAPPLPPPPRAVPSRLENPFQSTALFVENPFQSILRQLDSAVRRAPAGAAALPPPPPPPLAVATLMSLDAVLQQRPVQPSRGDVSTAAPAAAAPPPTRGGGEALGLSDVLGGAPGLTARGPVALLDVLLRLRALRQPSEAVAQQRGGAPLPDARFDAQLAAAITALQARAA